MASIRTNLQAGLISRQLSNINRRFTTNLERLSTGLRLNRPDDSPGQYGVVINQNLQIQSLNQGVINAQNAAGMLQTAEEGINTIIDVLNRAHDLAVTAADATLTQAQRQQAQDEVDRLLTASDGSSEIQQILDNVNYNGVKLLADSQKSAAVQGGAIGAVGGGRDTAISGGDKQAVQAQAVVTGTGVTTLFAASATGSISTKFTAVTQTGLSTVLSASDKAGMTVTLNTSAVANGDLQKGDILELNVITSAGTTSDQVIIASVDDRTTGGDYITVFNAQGYDKALNNFDALTSTFGTSSTGTATTSTSFSVNRIPQTLILDSTGATATSESARNFDSTIGTQTVNLSSEFREVLHVGAALKATGDSNPATLSRVNISFADTNALSAAQKIESAIEEQLGGEYRAGGALHIDVTAVANIYKLENTGGTSIDTTANRIQIASNGELTAELWADTQALMGTGSMTSWSGTQSVGMEFADLRSISFKFSTTTTAGVKETPELRVMSDELAGYSDVDLGRGRLFGNSLSIATGQHGNDKFMLTIDGEEVEVDLDADFATSTAGRVDTLVDALDKVTIDTSTAAALNASVFRMGIGDANTAAGVSAASTQFTTGNAAASGANYDLGTATSRNYTGGYYSQDNLRTMMTSAINLATKSAADASVNYDHSTRTFTITTGSRSNLSSLKVGESVQTDIALDGGGSATNLIDTTPGTSGFIGALGLTELSSSQGAGSYFEFRLGGGTDTFAIDFGTFGVTNMGADTTDISNITLATQSGASSAISVIETALDSISTTQTRIGAGINHMSRRVNVMESHREALRGAKARIEEIDFTVETRNLASLQILLQSSTAALAQANIIPQTLLQLLA